MRKGFLFLVVLMATALPVTGVRALEISGSNDRFAIHQGSQPLSDIVITLNDASLPVTAEHGINLFIQKLQWALWEEQVVTLTATGSAVEHGKMAAQVPVTYSADYKMLHIPVLANWAVGESATLSGLKVRVYFEASGNQPLEADVTGDLVPDLLTTATIFIDSVTSQSDRTPPSPARNVTGKVLQTPWEVELTWSSPADYDFAAFSVSRTRTRAGRVMEDWIVDRLVTAGYTDTDVQEGDTVEYKIYSEDRYRNQAEPVIVTVTVGEATPSVTPPPVSPPPTTPAPADSATPDSAATAPVTPALATDEIGLLTRLFNYYKTRYQTSCRPGGRLAAANDSVCLWAKIDLLYAQKKLDRPALDFSLSERDLYLLRSRVPFSANRFKTRCADPQNQAPFCKALGRALKRADTFLAP